MEKGQTQMGKDIPITAKFPIGGGGTLKPGALGRIRPDLQFKPKKEDKKTT